jgi:hypothetical protein
MNTGNTFFFFLILLATEIFSPYGAPSAFAFSPSNYPVAVIIPGPPPLVRLTGTLQPADENPKTGARSLNIFTGDANWQFILHDVKTLTYATNPNWSILNDLVPARLHFVGPDDLLRALRAAEHGEAPVSVTGRLYISSRMFFVTGVEPAKRRT